MYSVWITRGGNYVMVCLDILRLVLIRLEKIRNISPLVASLYHSEGQISDIRSDFILVRGGTTSNKTLIQNNFYFRINYLIINIRILIDF